MNIQRPARTKSRTAPASTEPSIASQRFASAAEGLAAADAALTQQGIDAALAIVAALREQFPDDPEPLFVGARFCKEAGQLAHADDLLTEGRQCFPGNIGFHIGGAWLAHERRDFDAAVERWAKMRAAFPDSPAGYHGGAVSLRDAGRVDDAEALARTATERFPDDSSVADEYARAAFARREFAEAARRWRRVMQRFP